MGYDLSWYGIFSSQLVWDLLIPAFIPMDHVAAAQPAGRGPVHLGSASTGQPSSSDQFWDPLPPASRRHPISPKAPEGRGCR